MEKLIWKPVIGFEGRYEISNRGDIRTLWRTVKRRDGTTALYRSRILQPTLSNRGYLHLILTNENGRRIDQSIHRLVALAFIPTGDTSLLVNHIDGNQTNNRVSNLEWATNQQNQHHARDTGLHKLSKPVEALNPATGELIKFPSLNVARMALGIASTAAIRRAAKLGGIFKGLKWGWVE